jgi:hypothetical protein
MKHKKQDLDAIIDAATSGIREEQIDESLVNKSASRVWARVSQHMAEQTSLSADSNSGSLNIMNSDNTAEHINGCADFQSLIPAYLDGKLSTARTLLLEDHSNECIPCRQALKARRSDTAAKTATYVPRQHVSKGAQGRRLSTAKGW